MPSRRPRLWVTRPVDGTRGARGGGQGHLHPPGTSQRARVEPWGLSPPRTCRPAAQAALASGSAASWVGGHVLDGGGSWRSRPLGGWLGRSWGTLRRERTRPEV